MLLFVMAQVLSCFIEINIDLLCNSGCSKLEQRLKVLKVQKRELFCESCIEIECSLEQAILDLKKCHSVSHKLLHKLAPYR